MTPKRTQRAITLLPKKSGSCRDDRNERPGVKFKDFDLIGIPVRVVVGEKNLPNVEIKLRKESEARLVPAENAAEEIKNIVKAELSALNS